MDKLAWVLSIYLVPLGIALISIAAVSLWQDQYATGSASAVKLQTFEDASESGAALTLQQARAALQSAPLVDYFDTKRSENPIWFAFSPAQADKGTLVIEFPSRHATQISCWDRATLQPLGTATRAGAQGAFVLAKAGFALNLNDATSSALCQANFVGPARLTAAAWTEKDLRRTVQEFHRNSGLLDGGLIVLAVFVLMTAWINRQILYVLFAAWLVVTLRMSAISAGWDIQWLGHSLPTEWLAPGRAVTVAIYGLLTLALFRNLFAEDLHKTRFEKPLRYTQWLCLPFLVVSIMLPYKAWLPVMWLVAGTWSVLMTLSLLDILRRTRSRVAMWYGASLGVTFLSVLTEIAAAALGIKEFAVAINFVTVALTSSLLAALAIAEQMRMEHQQRLTVQAELEHNFNAMPIGLFSLDLQGRFISANPALAGMLGKNVLIVGHNSWQQYFDQGAWTQLHHFVYSRVDGELEIRGKRTHDDKEVRRYLVKATLSNDRIEGSLQDVTEKSRAAEDLNFLAYNDPLTKVLNRRGIENAFEEASALSPKGRPFALAYLDLDRFKLINDLFGHSAGDEVLQQVCKRITDVVSGSIKVGRVGGDEFTIVLPDTKMALAALVCQGIVRSIGSSPFRVGEKAFTVRGSIGLIEVKPGTSIKDAMSTADRACREAKRGHHDGLVVYEHDADAFHQHEAELRLVELLSTSAATDGLYLHMQPIMSLKAPNESLNFEVLLRMRDSAGNQVPTDRLIAAAENSGRMAVIDRWVLSTTLAWLSTHQRRLANTRFVCMNLSGSSLNDEKFMQDVFGMLAANADIARHLCIEITESVALHDLRNTRHFIDRVRSFGAKVALDDFGAGYTSFSYLKELPADLLKIDGSFIVNMNNHPANVAIVEAIVNLASNLGMQTIAEWAEDTATVQTLTEIGVNYVQGYIVSKPVAPEVLLTAESSASFIRDEQLIRFINILGKPEDIRAQVDLFDQMGARHQVH
ncbi:MAG TPA: EAL domain-containing protein [Burkholderiaceae bacterium]|nr:EAL domain-containing protein [Burkholderiaceae bacterium]